MSRQVCRDPILMHTRRILYTALTLLAAALVVLYVMAPNDPILPPLIMWILGVGLSTLMLLRRPVYPYWRSDGGPTLVLTPAQGRTLTFLRSNNGKRLSLWTGICVTALLPLAVGLGRHFPWEYPLLKDYATWSRPQQFGISGIAGFAAAGLGALAVMFLNAGVNAWCILRAWDWIQAHYEPWPLRGLGREFSCVAKRRELRLVRYQEQGARHTDAWLRPRTWRERVSFLCTFVGGIGLTLSSAHLVTVILEPNRYPYPEGAVKRLLILPLLCLGLLGLGRHLSKRRSGALGRN